MNRLMLVITLSALCGCVAKNPVLKVGEWKEKYRDGEGSGVVFALPQTRLELSYALERKTFTAGAHSRVADACQPGGPLHEDPDPICPDLRSVGLVQTLRLSVPANRYGDDRLCSTDGGNTEARIVVAEGATLQSDFVPDSNQVYVVPLRRNYFQTFDVQLELNANGTIGKGSLSTENLGTREFLEAATKVAGAQIFSLEELPPGPPRPADAEVAAARAALVALKGLIRDRDEIAARNDDEALASRAVQLTDLNARIARAQASFVGAVKTTPLGAFKQHWIPTVGDPEERIEGEFDACATKALESPRWLQLRVRADGKGLAPAASVGVASKDFSKARGWPYRVPVERDVEWQICGNAPKDKKNDAPAGAAPTGEGKAADSLSCETIDSKRLLLAQFGETLRLPEATGGRKSVIAPEYYADGSLKKLVISHVGESPAPLIAGVQGLLTPIPDTPPPGETAELTSQAALISARQALCRLVLAVPATDLRCLGPNPPTTLPPNP